ncbi:MAG: LacI family transcriptional regulator [Lachnospiraceae bacterium]|nr:LacI family transcriptional regulator [Lachnospiraceae bacterium]
MVSMKDIAVACGVSVATVSKALNDHGDIGDITKKHIKDVAEKMGYFPNSAAKALKTNRTSNLGVLFVDEANSGLTHDYFSSVLDSFKREAEKRGYDITFINCSKTGSNHMSYLAHARYRGVDGIVIACVNFDDEEVDELIRSDIPVVTIDHIFNDRITVLSDNVSGMRELVNYCYEMGHRKIAYIHGAPSAVTRTRISSFYKTTEELGLEIPDEYVVEAAYRSTTATHDQTLKLLELPDPPTCILYPDDFSTFGGINAIHEKGLSIPDDISIAGYDGITIAKHIEPKLTTLQQNTEQLGKAAAENLISLIEHPKSTIITQIVVPGELYPGGSVKKI